LFVTIYHFEVSFKAWPGPGSTNGVELPKRKAARNVHMTEFKDRRPRMEFFFARFNVRNVFLPRVRRVLDHWFKPLRKRRCFSNPSNWESTLSNSSGRIFSAIFHFLDFNQMMWQIVWNFLQIRPKRKEAI